MTEDTKKILFSGQLNIYYGQFYFDMADEDNIDEDMLLPETAFNGQENGICGAVQKGKLFFVTGISDGIININVDLHMPEPPVDETYGEVVEVPFQRGEEPVALCEWAAEATHNLDLPAGNFRVRYCIDGMDKDYDEASDFDAPLPGQRHLIQIWSSEAKPDKVVKQSSDMAAYWHKQWGGWS